MLWNAIFDPSGDQLTPRSIAGSLTTSTWLVPSAFITQMSSGPNCAPREKAIFVPSGDHAGLRSQVVSEVSAVWFEPSALITQISAAVELPDAYTIFDPSGDHAGVRLLPVVVSRVCDVPSAFIT